MVPGTLGEDIGRCLSSVLMLSGGEEMDFFSFSNVPCTALLMEGGVGCPRNGAWLLPVLTTLRAHGPKLE